MSEAKSGAAEKSLDAPREWPLRCWDAWLLELLHLDIHDLANFFEE